MLQLPPNIMQRYSGLAQMVSSQADSEEGSSDEEGGTAIDIPLMLPQLQSMPTFHLVEDDVPPRTAQTVQTGPSKTAQEDDQEYAFRLDLFRRIINSPYSAYAEQYSSALTQKIRKGVVYSPEVELAFQQVADAINLKL